MPFSSSQRALLTDAEFLPDVSAEDPDDPDDDVEDIEKAYSGLMVKETLVRKGGSTPDGYPKVPSVQSD